MTEQTQELVVMTLRESQNYIAALASQLTVGVMIPLMILALMVFAVWMLLARAQKDPKFDISEILRDDTTGKVSMTQCLKLGSFCLGGFILVISVFALPNLLETLYFGFLGTFGVTTIGVEFLKRRYPMPGWSQPLADAGGQMRPTPDAGGQGQP